MKELKPNSFIYAFDEALPDFLCDNMVERFEQHSAEQYEGRVGFDVGENVSLKKTTDLVVSGKAHWKDVDNNLFRSLGLAIREFQKQHPFFANMQQFRDMGYNLQRYQPGEYYNWHVDADSQGLASRQLVAIWYLNDVHGAGGETEFIYQDVRVRPKKGTLILFPPFWTHQHRAVTLQEGVKYIATTWITFR